jgi:zinc transport system substrate-binding protein
VLRLALLLVALLALSGCGGGDGDEGPTVVAAFYPLAWVAEEVAADDIDVMNLTPAGAEPHDLELTAGDIERVREADLVLYLGRGFMPALEDAVEGHENAIDLLEGQGLRDGEASEPDPHVWLDPNRLATIARTVADRLGDPAAGEDLAAQLEQLDAEFRDGLAECERRELVTSHAAFGYLTDAFGLRQIALTGLSPEAEPSPRALEDLVDEVEEVGATTVFFESLVSPRLAETVARETGARTAELDPLEGLSEDELEAGADYVSVMRDNLNALREALGCR